MIKLRNTITHAMYKIIIKPVCFKIDPEKVHDFFIYTGEKLGSNKITRNVVSLGYNYKNTILKQNILGISFDNPIGLSAGFDYNARLTKIIPSIGFGFATAGSITYNSYRGNKKPRLTRMPLSRSILVNKGLKSTGSKEIIKHLKNQKFNSPIGISIAKTNCKLTANEKEGIKDYLSSLKLFEKTNLASYYEINISCPNAFGGEPFTTPKKLNNLLNEIDKLKIKRPTFIKMPIDLSSKETEKLCDVAKKHNIQGLIFGNLTKDRSNVLLNKKELSNAGPGGFSGKPTEERSNNLIKFVYKKYKDRFIIIGCGGVFSAENAYKKIKLGASLVQLISGMIYEGPNLISKINYDLAKLVKKDGYKNISEAIGKDIKS